MDVHSLTDQVEELSQTYASRLGFQRDSTWFLLKLQEEVGELTQAHLMREGQARAKGLTSAEIDAAFRGEIADVFGHILLLARHHEVDLVEEIQRKWLVWLDDAPWPADFQASQRRPIPEP